jgi:HPt (histidine-containing phosphotransfer) domain-containing protein
MTQNTDAKPDEKIVVNVDSDIEDLIPGFLENRQQDVKSIYDALDKEDYETIRILGHSMKGAGGGYGFDEITDIGRSIEGSAEGKNQEEVKKWVINLSNYLDRVEIVYV